MTSFEYKDVESAAEVDVDDNNDLAVSIFVAVVDVCVAVTDVCCNVLLTTCDDVVAGSVGHPSLL